MSRWIKWLLYRHPDKSTSPFGIGFWCHLFSRTFFKRLTWLPNIARFWGLALWISWIHFKLNESVQTLRRSVQSLVVYLRRRESTSQRISKENHRQVKEKPMNLCYSHWFVVICENLVKVHLSFKLEERWRSFQVCCWLSRNRGKCAGHPRGILSGNDRKRLVEKILALMGMGTIRRWIWSPSGMGYFEYLWIFHRRFRIISQMQRKYDGKIQVERWEWWSMNAKKDVGLVLAGFSHPRHQGMATGHEVRPQDDT